MNLMFQFLIRYYKFVASDAMGKNKTCFNSSLGIINCYTVPLKGAKNIGFNSSLGIINFIKGHEP